jgi:hypothetical protein
MTKFVVSGGALLPLLLHHVLNFLSGGLLMLDSIKATEGLAFVLSPGPEQQTLVGITWSINQIGTYVVYYRTRLENIWVQCLSKEA